MAHPVEAVQPLAAPVTGTVVVPGSKSQTARALVAAALAPGDSVLRGTLVSEDSLLMRRALRALGAEIQVLDPPVAPPGPDLVAEARLADLLVRGPLPTQPAHAPTATSPLALDVGLAGTVARFLAPLCCQVGRPVLLDGTPRMRQRPMADLFSALEALGATVRCHQRPGSLPATLTGPLRGGQVQLPGHHSSQFLSGLLLAAPTLPQGLTVALSTPLVSRPYVDLTIATMAAFGVQVHEQPDAQGPGRPTFHVPPGQHYRPAELTIEPDASAASYVFAAAALTGSHLVVAGLTRDARQGDLAILEHLQRMGAVATDAPSGLAVAGTGRLQGLDVDLRDCSDLTQTLAVLAAFADRPSRLLGIGFIRGKESDRIGATVRQLRALGGDASELPDGLLVHPRPLRAGTLDPEGDHRAAMAFGVAGLAVPGIAIADPAVVDKTFPEYFATLRALHRLPARSGPSASPGGVRQP
jgi:3-phosphoshikimate 1-carboxyvinyltransferase